MNFYVWFVLIASCLVLALFLFLVRKFDNEAVGSYPLKVFIFSIMSFSLICFSFDKQMTVTEYSDGYYSKTKTANGIIEGNFCIDPESYDKDEANERSERTYTVPLTRKTAVKPICITIFVILGMIYVINIDIICIKYKEEQISEDTSENS